MTSDRASQLALPLLLLGGIAIGFSPVFVRLADVGPTASAFWRVGAAAPCLFAFMFMRGEGLGLRHIRDLAPLFLCSLFFALDLLFWHWSISFTTVANATLLSNLNPVVVAFVSVLLFGVRLTRWFYMGLVLAILGSALLSGASFSAGGSRLLGDGLAVVTAFFYGLYIVSVGRLRRRFTTLTVLAWTSLMTALILFPVAFLNGEQLLPASDMGWFAVLGLAFVAQTAGQGFISFALAHLEASLSALTLLIQPVVAAIVAWWLFQEALGPQEMAGALTILSGILLARLGGTRRREKKVA